MTAQIMAIINTSPDSFSGDGIRGDDVVGLRQKIHSALKEGADMLDIGGQSTRPGAAIITVREEISRVVPAVRIARELAPNMPISVDTFKPAVAGAAFEAGATMLNDVTGLRDKGMIRFAATTGCDIVVMHMRGTPQTMSQLTAYPDGVVTEVKKFFQEHIQSLASAGIATERLILDPGIGFAKTAPQSYELTLRLAELKELGCRVLYGASNKSFIGKALARNGEIAPVEDRAVGTVAVQTCALLNGADILRVHDVKAAVQTRAVVDALLGRAGGLS